MTLIWLSALKYYVCCLGVSIRCDLNTYQIKSSPKKAFLTDGLISAICDPGPQNQS